MTEDVGEDALRRKRPEKKVCVAARSHGRRKLEQGRVGGRRIPRRKSPVEERKRSVSDFHKSEKKSEKSEGLMV